MHSHSVVIILQNTDGKYKIAYDEIRSRKVNDLKDHEAYKGEARIGSNVSRTRI